MFLLFAEVQIGVEVLTINTSTRRVAKKLNIKDVAKWFEYEVKTLLRVMYYLKMKEDIDSSDPRFWHRFMMLMSTLGVYKPKKDCLQYVREMQFLQCQLKAIHVIFTNSKEYGVLYL